MMFSLSYVINFSCIVIIVRSLAILFITMLRHLVILVVNSIEKNTSQFTPYDGVIF